jgi:uncharacterized protein YcbK (DUF882 family)
MKKNNLSLFLTKILFLTFIFSIISTVNAEAKVTCRSIGLTYNKKTGKCNWNKKAEKPKYQRKGNVGCRNNKPGAVPLQKHGLRAANARAAHMKPEVLKYLVALKKKCSGLVVQSTYRDCDTNRKVGGKQKSRHLCGGAADTSGCPGKSKGLPSRVCNSSGLTFIDEGASRFPHCQSNCY